MVYKLSTCFVIFGTKVGRHGKTLNRHFWHFAGRSGKQRDIVGQKVGEIKGFKDI